jgi:hypothetical protein
VREQIKEFASTRMIVDKGLKLVILDEADAMTNDAQAALRRGIYSLYNTGDCDYWKNPSSEFYVESIADFSSLFSMLSVY